MDLSRYLRQTVHYQMSEEAQLRLLASRVVIGGCGAVGSALSELCVRAGVGYVRLVDRDVCELNNLQRQVLYDEDDVAAGLPKAVAAARKLRRLNSQVTVEERVGEINATTVADLLGGCDLIFDAVDNFDGRYAINDYCLQTKTPCLYGAVLGTFGVTLNILPGEGPCLRCLFPEAPRESYETCATGGIYGSTVLMVASLMFMEALKLLTGKRDELSRDLLQFDVWDREMHHCTVERVPGCVACADCRCE